MGSTQAYSPQVQPTHRHSLREGVTAYVVRAPVRPAFVSPSLNRNLADAHGAVGIAKIFIGRSEETEVHISIQRKLIAV
jgi:hypothetical protein